MSPPNSSGPLLRGGGYDHDQILESFEDSWRNGQKPVLAAFVPADDPERHTLVEELARLDLEYRIKRGEPALVETYVGEFPFLGESTRVVKLIETEFTQRLRRDSNVSVAEYVRRFPALREEVSARLSRLAPPARNGAPTSFECPGCRHAIPVAGATQPRDLTCPSCGQSYRFDPGHVRPGLREGLTRLGNFVLEGVVGKGSFGTVYRARDEKLQRTVAVKVPRAGWDSAEEEARFFREARAAAQLDHPGIVPIHELGHAEGCPYIVSGFVEGKTLADVLKLRRLGFHDTAALVVRVADAVEHAHQRQVIHRDLKPSNIMLGRLASGSSNGGAAPIREGHPFVMDFGLARGGDGELRVTRDGEVLGTPAYMSPEQARGESHLSDPRTDVYSLGVVLYESLTGELPFRGAARMVLVQIESVDPPPPRRFNDQLPRDLENITLKCLEKDPRRRYTTAGALRDDLQRFLDGKPVLARPVGPLVRVLRWIKRRPWQAAALFLLIVVAVGSPLIAWYIEGQRGLLAVAKTAAEDNVTLAEERLELTLDTIKDLSFNLVNQLDGKSALAGVRTKALERIKTGLDRVAKRAQVPRVNQAEVTLQQRLGDAAFDLGKFQEAHTHYQRAFALTESLRDGAPDSEYAARAAIAAHHKLSQSSLRLGQRDESLKHLQLAVDQGHALVARNPDNTFAQGFLVVTQLALAEVQLVGGEWPAARKTLNDTRERAAALVQREPREMAHRRGLASAHRQLGVLSLTERNAIEGKKHLTESLRVARALRELDADDPSNQRTLAQSLERLGDVCLDLKEYAQAESTYREAVQHRHTLYKKDPLHDGDERMRAVGNARLGQILGDLGDLPAAREHFERGIAQLQAFVEVFPRNFGALEDLGAAQERLGVLARRVGDVDEARKLFLQVLERRQKMAGPKPANYALGHNLTLVHGNLWLIELDCLDFAAAEKWANEAVRVLRSLEERGLVKSPKPFQGWVARHQNIITLCQLAPRVVDDLDLALKQPREQALDLLWYRARLLLKQEKYADAAATAEHLRKLEGKNPRILANVAAIHAVCVAAKEPELREQSQRQALATLTTAIALGYHDLARVASHSDYDGLRADPAFQKIVADFRTKLRGTEGK